MKQIRPFMNRPLIKVIAGIRRCGKSVVLQLIAEELERQGVEKGRIVYMNFESFEWMDIDNAKALYLYIKGIVEKAKGKVYILLDEIQEVKEWEKAVNSFLVDWDVDVYVTGSNSRLLSSELSTYLAGRYVSFHIMPLSFNEYLLFHGMTPDNKERVRGEFLNYLRMGGFPGVHTGNYSQEAIYKLVYDIYSSVILRDTVQRHGIRNVELLERVVRFVFDNVCKQLHYVNICNYPKRCVLIIKSIASELDITTLHNIL